MAYREVSRVEIAEVVRRWQSGESQRQIASGTGLSRKTVRRYVKAGVEAGLSRDGRRGGSLRWGATSSPPSPAGEFEDCG